MQCMYDGSGFVQLIKGIAEIAQGATKPSILPVWCRELLCARDPPRVTCIHHEYKQLPLQDDNKNVFFKPCHASFFFGSKEIDALRCLFPHHVAQSSNTFDVLSACLWRCHTAALHWQNPNQEVRFMCAVNARFEPCSFHCGDAMRAAHDLCIGVGEESKEGSNVTEEYVHSVADLMAIKGRPNIILEGSFLVSNITKCGFKDVDFGWGKSLYSGPADTTCGSENIPGGGESYFVPYTNSKGEHGTVVLICLPEEAMERFEKELNGILKIKDEEKTIKLMSNL